VLQNLQPQLLFSSWHCY